MSDRPSLISDTSKTRLETNVLQGIIYAGLVGLLLVFGARMFLLADKNMTKQSAEAPSTSELPRDGETKSSGKPSRPDLFGG
jgi:hypothetical protein